MLAHLSLTTSRFVDVCFEPSSGFSTHRSEGGENALVVDLRAFPSLFPQTPEKIWNSIAAYRKAVSPLYTNLHNALASDLQNVTKILLDLELRHADSLDDALPVGLLDEEVQQACNTRIDIQTEHAHGERPPRKRRRSSQGGSTIVIPSTHPLTPSIIITLAPTERRETSCHVPYQNSAFGNLLPVPLHPVFNISHPPFAERCLLPKVDKRKWENGHWVVILPSLGEQQEKGLFSRAISSRRKPCRSRSSGSSR